MNYQEHFKTGDIPAAQKEVSCIEDLLILILLHSDTGNFDKAQKRGQELLNSLEILADLNNHKKTENELKSLMDQLVQQGLDNQAVRMYFNER